MKERQLLQNWLAALEAEFSAPLPSGGILVVRSSAGVGKTAFLVQLAIGAMARDEKVLHINIGEAIDKVDLWYKELFKNISTSQKLGNIDRLWETIARNRLIMTFKPDTFSFTRLWERIRDVAVSGTFEPQIIIIDGFKATDIENMDSDLQKAKSNARANHTRIWLSINSDEKNLIKNTDNDDNKNYEVVIQLRQDGNRVLVIPQKGFSKDTCLSLDPVTMLLE